MTMYCNGKSAETIGNTGCLCSPSSMQISTQRPFKSPYYFLLVGCKIPIELSGEKIQKAAAKRLRV